MGPWAPGARIGRFVLGEPLGRGATGVVLAARDERSGERVALKAMPANDPTAIARFEREVKLVASLSHPNVVRVLDAGFHAGSCWLALELAAGGSLEERIARAGPLPWREAAGIVAGVARGLAAAHALGLVHRDVKPANVLFAGDRPLLADFGLVRTIASDSGSITRSGELVGTPHYLAPEVVAGAPADERSDLYALGATLFHALTGSTVFEGDPLAVLRKHGTERPRRPSELAPTVPAGLDALVLALLEKSPGARPSSAAHVAHALAELLEQRAGRSRVAVATGAFALAVAVAGLGTLALRPDPTSAPRTPPAALPPGPTGKPETPPPPIAPPEPEHVVVRARAAWGSTAWKTRAAVRAVAFDPSDGHPFAGGDERTFAAWDWTTGQPAPLALTDGAVRAIAVSPEGATAIVAIHSGRLMAMSLRDGRHAESKAGPEALGVALVGSTTAVTTSTDGIRIWNFEPPGSDIAIVQSHAAPLCAFAASRAGDLIVTGDESGTITFWPMATPEHARSIHAAERPIALAVLDDGTTLASLAGEVVIVSPERAGVVRLDVRATRLAAIPGGGFVAIDEGRGGTVVRPGGARTSLASVPAKVHDVAVSRDGSRAIVAADDGLWPYELATGRSLRRTDPGFHERPVDSLAYSSDGTVLASVSEDALLLHDVASARALRFDCDGGFAAVAFPGGDRLVAATRRGPIELLASGTGERLAKPFGPPAPHDRVAIGADAALVATARAGELSFWASVTGESVPGLRTRSGRITALAIDPVLTLAAVGDSLGGTWLKDAERKQDGPRALGTMTGQVVRAVALARGRVLAGGSAGGLASWRLETGDLDAQRALDSPARALALDRTGRHALLATEDGRVALLDAVTLAPLATIPLPGDRATSLAFAPDGKSCAVGTERTSVLVFGLED